MFYTVKIQSTMYPVTLNFKPQGKGDESIAHSAEVRYVPADSRRR